MMIITKYLLKVPKIITAMIIPIINPILVLEELSFEELLLVVEVNVAD